MSLTTNTTITGIQHKTLQLSFPTTDF